jgi:nitrate reductase beta subunit
VGRVRFVGYKEDTAGPIHKLAEEWKVALPLYPQFGTEPNVFYVPPTSPPSFAPDGRIKDPSRIPITYLEELFGPKVRQALATLTAEMDRRRRGEKSELMEILIGYTNKDRFTLA